AGGTASLAGHARAPPARAAHADHAWPSIDGREGLCGPRSGTRLRPGARLVSTDRGHRTVLPGAAGIMVFLSATGGVTDSTGAGRATPQSGPAGRRPGAPLRGALCTWEYFELFGRLCRGPGAFGAGDRPLRSPAAPYPCAPLRPGLRGGLLLLCRLDPVAAWLSGPGLAEKPRGTHPGPGGGAPLQPGVCPALRGRPPLLPSGGPPGPGAERGRHHHSGRARVYALVGAGHDA